MNSNEIIAMLPYARPFLFVDEILSIDEAGVTGTYRFDPESFFYQGHFKDHPVTPGVILTETMAQIGLVSLGIFLLADVSKLDQAIGVAFTSSQMDFFVPVFPGEKVMVKAQKEYFRFNKLKCKVEMYNEKNELVCRGLLAGMLRLEE